jgi:GntR family transcriptional regulator
MYHIDAMSRVPVYEQIVEQTEKFILAGILKPGDKIPSVRNLSIELSVNPNTIQKSIVELDRRGLILSVPGKGCYVAEEARTALSAVKRKKMAEIKDEIKELALAGVTKEELLELIEEVFTKKEGQNND